MDTLIRTPTVRLFQPDDAACLVNRDGMQVDAAQLIRQASLGEAWTACIEDRPIAAAGIIVLWPGVGVVWMTLTDDMAHYGIWLTRTTKAFLDEITIRHRLHRIEAVALEASPRNQRWLDALGFTSERDGVARQYLHDQRSVIRYERIRS